ncbi:hypothetical protein [Engelhardtia mirabilis]|uniref:hypothetical protein n=1 Tax=Engelhardtia mirabilis TaxID=2528011 RepID=UPI003AF39902
MALSAVCPRGSSAAIAGGASARQIDWTYSMVLVDPSGEPIGRERLQFTTCTAGLRIRRATRVRTERDGSVELLVRGQFVQNQVPEQLLIGDPLEGGLGTLIELPDADGSSVVDLGRVELRPWPELCSGRLVTDEGTAPLAERGLVLAIELEPPQSWELAGPVLWMVGRAEVGAGGQFELRGARPAGDQRWRLLVPDLDLDPLVGDFLETHQVARVLPDVEIGGRPRVFELLSPAYLALSRNAKLPRPAGADLDLSDVVIGFKLGSQTPAPQTEPEWRLELRGPKGDLLATETLFDISDVRMDVDYAGTVRAELWSSFVGAPILTFADVELRRGKLTQDERLFELSSKARFVPLPIEVRLPDGSPASEGLAHLESAIEHEGTVARRYWETRFGSDPLLAQSPLAGGVRVDAEIWVPGCFRTRVEGVDRPTTVRMEPGGEVVLRLPRSVLEQFDLVAEAVRTDLSTFDDPRVDSLERTDEGFRGHLSAPGEWTVVWRQAGGPNGHRAYLGDESFVVEAVPEAQTIRLRGPSR